MKRAIILSVISTQLFVSCMTYKQLSGNYVYNNSIELRFTENPNRFEYYTRGEMGLLQYSTGEWKRNKNKVYLTGFTDKDVNMLNVESAVAKSINSNDTQVQIFYSRDKAAPYIKSVVIINDNAIYKIAKDTILAPEYKVETIQAKSYLSYEGLLSSPPKVDTLYSRKIRIDDAQGKTIMLKFSVNSKDFVRTTLADTIEVKNNRTLLYNKIKLKKIAMVQEAAK